MEGSTIELREMAAGDTQDYLDGSRVRPGAQLLLWMNGQWISAQYELASLQPREVVLRTRDGQLYPLDRATMRFRWPRS